MPDLIQLRRGIAAQWTAVNPILRNGEPGAELDTSKLKIGDGVTAWNSLDYVGGSGSGITELTGDVTAGPGSGSEAATIANGAVSLAKMADLAADRLIGRGNGGGTGVPQAISLGTGLALSGTTLSASASGGVVAGIDPRSALYKPFTPAGVDDEFSDGSFSGWTYVTPGTQDLTTVEENDCLSIYNPGSQVAQSLRAYLKAATINTNDIIEVCFSGMGRGQNFNIFGLIMSDGTTHGAGAQFCFYFSPQETAFGKATWSNFSAITGFVGYAISSATPSGLIFMRMKYEGSNNWSGWISADNSQWINVTGTVASTLTPTHLGFFCTSYGGTLPFVWSVRYFRKTT